MSKVFVLSVICTFLVSACASLPSDTFKRLDFLATTEPSKAQQIAEHGLHKFVEGDLVNSGAYADVALSMDSTNHLARRIALKVALNSGDWSAIQTHLQHLSADALDIETLGLLGIVFYEQGDMEGARPLLETAFSHDPEQWKLILTLSRLECEAGDLVSAQKYLDQANRNSESSAEVLMQQGNIYSLSGAYPAAQQSFEHALEVSDGQIGDGLNYRLSLARNGQILRALDGLGEKQKAVIFRELGRLAMRDEEKLKAVKYLKQAQSLFPKYDQDTERLLGKALRLPSVS